MIERTLYSGWHDLDFFDKEEKVELKELHKKYPVIFSNERSFQHSHGWYKVLDELCSQLTTIMNKVGIVVTAEQVKEKFGTLRFYYSVDYKDLEYSDSEGWDNIIRSLVSRAEMMSGYTCERCGERGKIRPGGWIKTLCDKCDSKEFEVSTAETTEHFAQLRKQKEAKD